ncbi:MAG: Extracellular solute-binding protein [Deltaproteobacteria bacterium]|nr:Extracellular solute-binding protein [Deltaproteobacteria bacterium]
MKLRFSRRSLVIGLSAFLFASPVHAATPISALAKARQDAEARGLLFVSDRAEILSRAQKEARLSVITSMEPETAKASAVAFKKRYPFIDLNIQPRTGSESAQQLVLQIKSGAAKEWDVVSTTSDLINDYIPHLWKVDLQGMAEQGVLRIPLPMVDSTQRNIAAFHSRFQVIAYNKNLVLPAQIPKAWEDLLRPEFKGRKISLDIRPGLTTLIPGWGLDRTVDFARKLASQEPIWVRGDPRAITGMLAGEIPMMVAANFHDLKRAQKKDPLGVLQYTVVEPVPFRLALAQSILATARHPYAALLWFDWLATVEAQKIADEHEPMASAVYVPGSAVEQELRGKKLSAVPWENYQNLQPWSAKIFEAYGFPKADAQR